MLHGNIKKALMIFIVAVFTVCLLLGIYYGFNKYFVDQPLSNTLQNSEFIENFTFNKKGKTPLLKIKLNKTSDLAQEFENFIDSSGELINEKEFKLEIYSNPNDKLNNFYYKISPAIYEAIALKNYTLLQNSIYENNQDFNIEKTELKITDKYIFLQLEDYEYYLYLVFNRQDDSFPKIVNRLGKWY